MNPKPGTRDPKALNPQAKARLTASASPSPSERPRCPKRHLFSPITCTEPETPEKPFHQGQNGDMRFRSFVLVWRAMHHRSPEPRFSPRILKPKPCTLGGSHCSSGCLGANLAGSRVRHPAPQLLPLQRLSTAPSTLEYVVVSVNKSNS